MQSMYNTNIECVYSVCTRDLYVVWVCRLKCCVTLSNQYPNMLGREHYHNTANPLQESRCASHGGFLAKTENDHEIGSPGTDLEGDLYIRHYFSRAISLDRFRRPSANQARQKTHMRKKYASKADHAVANDSSFEMLWEGAKPSFGSFLVATIFQTKTHWC